MSDHAEHLNRHIAERVRALRASRGLTLDALAERSGVSRSMISSVERAESSPTAVLLERLAAGLGIPLASLFDMPCAIFRQRKRRLGLIPCRRATAEIFVPGGAASATMACFSASLQRRRVSAIIVYRREKPSPDIIPDLAPVVTNHHQQELHPDCDARRPWPDGYTSGMFNPFSKNELMAS